MKKCNTKNIPALVRFSVSMGGDLVRQLDGMVKAKKCANRSRAIADMVRSRLVEHGAEASHCEIVGTVTLVYDHHKRDLQTKLTDIQHDHEDLIISVLHVHLNHHHCMEVLAVRGRVDAIKNLAESLIAVKGVQHGKLTVTTTEKEFS